MQFSPLVNYDNSITGGVFGGSSIIGGYSNQTIELVLTIILVLLLIYFLVCKQDYVKSLIPDSIPLIGSSSCM